MKYFLARSNAGCEWCDSSEPRLLGVLENFGDQQLTKVPVRHRCNFLAILVGKRLNLHFLEKMAFGQDVYGQIVKHICNIYLPRDFKQLLPTEIEPEEQK